ncbi:sensor histidine kinase [Kribbella albertanoniae]|uniref:histidine kinase n=1 Tax=Kribbella albertanoniae TaxID=1266829 RepID=A0A4R4P9C9_9ACTN|nr:sensor histidine kinase [Kribbella albertanoniae]TDC17580.1 sensor histidine kinase [Kribbella albertanoniae]
MTTDDLSGSSALLGRLSQFGQRLRQADREHPVLLDAAVVVLVFLIFCMPDLADKGSVDGDAPPAIRALFTELPVAQVLAFQAGLVLPLFWRRRRPLVAFGVVGAVFVLQWSLSIALRADIALAIALYSLALHGRLRQLLWACGLSVGALVLVAARIAPAFSFWDALFFLISAGTAAAALGLMIRLRRAQLETLRDRAARLEIERDQRSRLATATERTRVAREMHDIVGHNLAVMITLADAGAYATDAAPERGKQTLLLIGDTGRQALSELRRVLGVLREDSTAPDLSPQPGIAAIDALCSAVGAAGLDIVYRTSGETDALDSGVQLTVYRIVQEALTNALRHAGAGTRVQLSIAVEDTQLTLSVHDNGSATPSRPRNQEGHGLIGMHERAALYGGSVSAGPAPGGGWTVEAVLDLGGAR